MGKLTALSEAVSRQVFGQTAQTLLAVTFDAGGFEVTTPNTIGVPDFVASHATRRCRIAVEVKTGSPIRLSRRDLDGAANAGDIAVVAALLFPDRWPRWVLVEASMLRAGTWELRKLE